MSAEVMEIWYLKLGCLAGRCYQGRIEPPKAARGHVTSVNGKIQNNVICRTSLLLLATPDVREIRGARTLHDAT